MHYFAETECSLYKISNIERKVLPVVGWFHRCFFLSSKSCIDNILLIILFITFVMLLLNCRIALSHFTFYPPSSEVYNCVAAPCCILLVKFVVRLAPCAAAADTVCRGG